MLSRGREEEPGWFTGGRLRPVEEDCDRLSRLLDRRSSRLEDNKLSRLDDSKLSWLEDSGLLWMGGFFLAGGRGGGPLR